MNNRYYIVDVSGPNKTGLDRALSVCVESLKSMRKNNDNTKAVVKLKEGDKNQYGFLKKYPEYTHEEVLEELRKPEWNKELV